MTPMPFLLRPPTLAPGTSHYISNASLIAARAALGLQNPVRIQFDKEEKSARQFAMWCRRQQGDKVKSIQLRREKKAPFFHQYVAFCLACDRGCFRVDRRQLPDEGSPLDCTEEAGVEAYETIEEIKDLEDSIYSPSDCLVHVEFGSGVRIELILDICSAISLHENARIYTIQRYNCYFYAQTLLLCTVCSENDWYEKYIWGSGPGSGTLFGPEDLETFHMPLEKLTKNPNTVIRILDNHPKSTPIELKDGARPEKLLLNQYDSAWKVTLRLIRPQRKNSHSSLMKSVSIGELQAYISDMICAHAALVEVCKFMLRCDALEVEQDIKRAMNDIWGKNPIILGQVREMEAIVPYLIHQYPKPQQGLKRSARVAKDVPDDWVLVP